jgi:hypothetical protein
VRVTWRDRWNGQPLWAKCVIVAYAVGFADGTGAHVRDLARGGFHAYSAVPPVVQVFFVGLVVLDPLVAVLILSMRRAGPWLAAVVMAADVAGNWYVNWPGVTQDPWAYLRPVGLAPITFFGLFVLGSRVPLRRSLCQVDASRGRLPG